MSINTKKSVKSEKTEKATKTSKVSETTKVAKTPEVAKVVKIELPTKKLGIKELVYAEFLNATMNGKALPEANEIREMLLANGIDKDNMAIVKIKNHYSFYKSKWQDIVSYGKIIYTTKS